MELFEDTKQSSFLTEILKVKEMTAKLME